MSDEQNKNYFFCSATVAYGDRGRGGNWRALFRNQPLEDFQ
jgi:hypothetical protein